jgi:hypothetical protein
VKISTSLIRCGIFLRDPFWETSPEELLKYLDMNKKPIFVKKKLWPP